MERIVGVRRDSCSHGGKGTELSPKEGVIALQLKRS